MEKTIKFPVDQVVLYAKFVAQLVREGVTFEGHVTDDYLIVTLTGGF